MIHVTVFLDENPHNFIQNVTIGRTTSIKELENLLKTDYYEFLKANDLEDNFGFVKKHHKRNKRTVFDHFVRIGKEMYDKSRGKATILKTLVMKHNVKIFEEKNDIILPIVYIHRIDNEQKTKRDFFASCISSIQKTEEKELEVPKYYRFTKDYMGRNLLHYACIGKGNYNALKTLLDQGYDVLDKDSCSKSPLMYLAESFNKKAIEKVLQVCGPQYVEDFFDMAAFSFLEKGQKVESFKEIEEMFKKKVMNEVKSYFPQINQIDFDEKSITSGDLLKTVKYFRFKRNHEMIGMLTESLKLKKIKFTNKMKFVSSYESEVDCSLPIVKQIEIFKILSDLLNLEKFKLEGFDNILKMNYISDQLFCLDQIKKIVNSKMNSIPIDSGFNIIKIIICENSKISLKKGEDNVLKVLTNTKFLNTKKKIVEAYENELFKIEEFSTMLQKNIRKCFEKIRSDFVVNFSENCNIGKLGNDYYSGKLNLDLFKSKYFKEVYFGEKITINKRISFPNLDVFYSFFEEFSKILDLVEKFSFEIDIKETYFLTNFKSLGEKLLLFLELPIVKDLIERKDMRVHLKLNFLYAVSTLDISLRETETEGFDEVVFEFNNINLLEKVGEFENVVREFYMKERPRDYMEKYFFLSCIMEWTESSLKMKTKNVIHVHRDRMKLFFKLNDSKEYLCSCNPKGTSEFEIFFTEDNMKYVDLSREYQTLFAILVIPNEKFISHSFIIDFPFKFGLKIGIKEKKKVVNRMCKLVKSHSIKVDRNNLFLSSRRVLMEKMYWAKDISLSVTFFDEKGIGIGVKREWFELLTKSMFNIIDEKKSGFLFKSNPVGDFEVNDMIYNKKNMDIAGFCGEIFGRSILFDKYIHERVSFTIIKQLLKQRIELKDLELIDPVLFKQMKYVLECEDASSLSLNFTIFSKEKEKEVIELVPNGSNITLNNSNRNLFVEKYLEYMYEKPGKLTESFLNGFFRVIPQSVLFIFTDNELRKILEGKKSIKINSLKKVTNFTKSMSITEKDCWKIEYYFWNILKRKDQKYRSKVLQFITGLEKIPISGLEKSITIQIYPYTNFKLPSSHTCSFQMEIANFPNEKEMEKALDIVVQNGGFVGFSFL